MSDVRQETANHHVIFLSSSLSIKCSSASADRRIYEQYYYNLQGFLLYKSTPIEGIQAGTEPSSDNLGLCQMSKSLSYLYPGLTLS